MSRQMRKYRTCRYCQSSRSLTGAQPRVGAMTVREAGMYSDQYTAHPGPPKAEPGPQLLAYCAFPCTRASTLLPSKVVGTGTPSKSSTVGATSCVRRPSIAPGE